MLFFGPHRRDRSVLPHDPFKAVIAPRPIGQVLGVHLDERYVVDGIVDTAAMRPIARCGCRGDYTVVEKPFEMFRPD
jgi:hypothetical protein